MHFTYLYLTLLPTYLHGIEHHSVLRVLCVDSDVSMQLVARTLVLRPNHAYGVFEFADGPVLAETV